LAPLRVRAQRVRVAKNFSRTMPFAIAMAAHLHVRETDKRRLNKLRSELQAKSGRRVTTQDLMAKVISLAQDEKERLLGASLRPMNRREIAALMRLPVNTGIRTCEEEIDDTLAKEFH